MKVIQLGKEYINVPTEWNELTAEQLIEVMETVYLRQYEPLVMLMKLMKIIFSLSYRKFFKMKVEDQEEYLYLVQFLLDDPVLLTKQIIPEYKNLYGPSDEIGNMTMAEFTFSEHYYMEWQENRKDEALLNNLVAVLYRQGKKN